MGLISFVLFLVRPRLQPRRHGKEATATLFGAVAKELIRVLGGVNSGHLDLCGRAGVSVFYQSLKRGLDVLLSHPSADPERTAVTGALMVLAAGLMLAVLVLLWRWRASHAHQHEALRAREQHLTVALWGSGEQFWDFDLERRELHLLHADESELQPGHGLVVSNRLAALPLGFVSLICTSARPLL